MSFESQDGDSYAGDDERKRDSSRKREGKKEKKEKGYQVFEEEDSEEEQLVLAEEIKSPSKTKKERLKPTFKFPVPVRKEKGKEKEEKKDKESKQEEKEKKKEEKKKHKKEKKKVKLGHPDSSVEISEPSENENPIFAVPLAVSVERNKSHDGIELPAIVRECIDYIEECGLAREGIYRISGVKSKVQHLKDCYNRQQPVYLYEHEPNIVASLLKQYLRDLPEPVLTTALMPKFEEASTIKSNKKKVESFTRLISELPTCNRLLLSWMIVHMTHVIDLAKENKMTLQNVSIVLSPTMQISHRVLNVLFSNVTILFGDVLLRKYVPPLKPAHSKWTLELPDNPSALEEELAKQESLLNQLHADLNSGRKDPVIEEQLWEVQRVVTQLKRKIKMAKKNVEMGEWRRTNVDSKRLSTASIPSLSAPEELQLDLRPPPDSSAVNTTTVVAVVERQPEEKAEIRPEHSLEPKKGVKFAESTKKNRAPQIGEIKKLEDEENADKTKEEEVGKSEEEAKVMEVSSEEGTVSVAQERGVSHVKNAEDGKTRIDVKEELGAEVSRRSADVVKELEKEREKQMEEKSEVEKVEEKKESERAEEDVVEKIGEEQSREVKKTEMKTESIDELKTDTKQESVDLHSKEVKVQEVNHVEGDTIRPQEPPDLPKAEPVATEVELKAAVTEAVFKPKPGATEIVPKPRTTEVVPKSRATEAVPKPAKVEYEYRKAPNPPFMSTALLQPMKAEIPKPKRMEEDIEALRENIRKSEELRELEEELLGEKKEKAGKDLEDIPEDVDVDKMLEEEYALKLEEEELLAIGDELRQKIATERSEMERLNQEIQELQYLRQDSDLEDLSSSSSSSDESEDEEDLQDLVSQLIQENEELEMSNADMCQKIHEERMICLSVKLQIRLLQQKQLESSYG